MILIHGSEYEFNENATSVTIMNHLMEVASTFGAELSGRTAKYITVLKKTTRNIMQS